MYMYVYIRYVNHNNRKKIRLLTNRYNFWIFVILFTLGLANTATAILEIFLARTSNDISQR